MDKRSDDAWNRNKDSQVHTDLGPADHAGDGLWSVVVQSEGV